MTLLNVYRSNGHQKPATNGTTRYSDIMRDFFGENYPLNHTGFTKPRVNIMEEKEGYRILMALPGLKKPDLSIELDQDILTISRVKPDEEETTRFTRREFDYSRFERSFNLPEDINQDKIKASMENGILEIYLPRREEAIDKGPRNIRIS